MRLFHLLLAFCLLPLLSQAQCPDAQTLKISNYGTLVDASGAIVQGEIKPGTTCRFIMTGDVTEQTDQGTGQPCAKTGLAVNLNFNIVAGFIVNLSSNITMTTALTVVPGTPAPYSYFDVMIDPTATRAISFSFRVNGETTLFYLTFRSPPLAVEGFSFDAKKNTEGVQIDWSTATETDNASFSVERSINATEFETIQIVKGKGTTILTSNYSFFDASAKSFKNALYYRLKATDFQGVNTFSKVKAIEGDSKSKLGVKSFRFDNNDIVFQSTVEEDMKVNISNLSGQVLKTIDLTTVVGENKMSIIDANLSNGLYLVQVSNGKEVSVEKIVKSK